MLFSSLVFLYLFLPVTLFGYYISPRGVKNYWLLFCSLVFFAWGGVSITVILIISIVLNYFFGLMIGRYLPDRRAYYWLAAGVASNLILLCVFKYANFLVLNLNQLLVSFQIPPVEQTSIILPIGISFYTFHALSYLVDIYRGKSLAQKNIFDLSLYICMFSQLIAGPIIRYSDVWQQLRGRDHTLYKFSTGVERFLIGLAKKVLLANNFALVADENFTLDPNEITALTAWMGLVCYTLQIYFDFAGYSDMAIGLGRMFGFEFMENFNYPYISRSVKEFWRRWHISLSSFFRDYVYIPLGGNRVSVPRSYVNLIFVFFLTGFWHGASWSFVVWGLFHGFFMLIERAGFEKILDRLWKPVSILYTMLVVMFAWVLFRADSLTYAIDYWAALFRFENEATEIRKFYSQISLERASAFAVALAGSFGLFPKIYSLFTGLKETTAVNVGRYAWHVVSACFFVLVIYVCTLYLIAGTYNPFIYYRF